MTSIQIDIRDGLSSSVAIKGPCRVATTANITLSGEQTIDGVAVVTDDRVLVKDQTTGSENGIWICDTGAWRRSKDFNKSKDVKRGSLVSVTDGSTNTGIWQLSSTDPITIDTTSISFELVSNAALAGVTPGATGLALLAAATAAAAFSIVADTSAFNQTTTGHFWADAGARIHKMNDRIMLGAATINDGNAVPTVKDWLETLRDSTTKNAQFAAISTIGQGAILGATRTSDFPGAASQGAIGIQGWAINNNATQVQSAFAGYFEARRSTGAGTTHGIEIDIVNAGSLVDIQPYGTYDYSSGITPGLWVASGGTAIGAVDATAGIAIINNGARFRKGIVFQSNSLLGTDGTGTGTANAIEMARAHKVRWMRANGTEAANIYSDVTNGGPLQTIQFTDVGLLYRNTNAKNLLAVAAADNFVNGFLMTPTVTAGQPVLSVAGDDTNIALGFATKGTGALDVFTNSTVRQLQVAHVASAVNYLQAKGAATAGAPQLSALGSDTNVSLAFATQGTGLFDFFTNGNVRQFRVYDTPSAVNYFQLSGAATGAATTLASVGSDTNVSMVLQSKGSGSVFVNSNGTIVAEFQNPASAVNRFLLQGTVTTGSPIIVATGTDTNVAGILRGKGTGGFDLQDGASVSKFKYNTTGIGFFNATPVARGAQAALTGTIQRGTFDTATVTLPQLAGVVMAIINDWRAFGFAS